MGAKAGACSSKESFLKLAHVTSSLARAQSCGHTLRQGSLRSVTSTAGLQCSEMWGFCTSNTEGEGRLGTGKFVAASATVEKDESPAIQTLGSSPFQHISMCLSPIAFPLCVTVDKKLSCIGPILNVQHFDFINVLKIYYLQGKHVHWRLLPSLGPPHRP